MDVRFRAGDHGEGAHDRLRLLEAHEHAAPPESFDQILAVFETGHKKVSGLISQLRDDEMYSTVQFFTGPGRIGDMSRAQFLWFMLHDQIHHRGQFSIYLRMADGKVPAIYGPSADEPWT